MAKKSAGLMLFRDSHSAIEVLLVHPGGPFWSKKDDGAWSIPKGEFEDSEQPLDAAIREFEEETGCRPSGEFLALEAVKQPSGKLIFAWAIAFDFDPSSLKSNTFTMEWPPKSGRQQEFPEIDQAEWFGMAAARQKILKGQAPFLDQLLSKLGRPSTASESTEKASTTGRDKTRGPQGSLFGDD